MPEEQICPICGRPYIEYRKTAGGADRYDHADKTVCVGREKIAQSDTMHSAWEGIKQQIKKNIPAEEILKEKPKRKAAKSWLESLWEDLPDADTADWGPLEEHIEMGYDFGYSLPVGDVKETVDNQLVVFEKYDEKINADWITFMLADAIENSKWDSERCKDEMSGDPSHLIALCRLGLNDGIDDLYRLFPEAKKVTPEQLKEWRDRGVSSLK